MEYGITTSFNKKGTKRSVDYRKSIIIVTGYWRNKICSFGLELLETVVNIKMLLYSDENKKTPIHIYRLSQQCLHFVLCKAITEKKIEGDIRKNISHLHSFVPYAGLQIRVVFEVDASAEGEDEPFQQGKSLTKGTSNNQPGNVISNILICSQVDEELKIHLYGQFGESWVKKGNVLSN